MRVVIIQPGIYNNEHGQPVERAKGDVLITVAGYGNTLVADGLAESVLPDTQVIQAAPSAGPEEKPAPEATLAEPPETLPETPAKPASKRRSRKKATN